MISDFRREVNESCALLRYYAASSGNFLLTFRYNLWAHLQGSRIKKRIQSARAKNAKRIQKRILDS